MSEEIKTESGEPNSEQSPAVEPQLPNLTSPKTGIFLKFGYQDKEKPEILHKAVSFGKRPTAADFMRAADDGGDSEFQFRLGLAQAAITEFGQLTMPVPLTVLLSLNQIDRELLMPSFFSFIADTGIEGATLGDGKVRLGFGIERAGVKITEIKFGRLLTGYDEIAIEGEAKTSWQSNALRMAKEIVQPDNVTLAEIESLDVDDFTLLRNAEEEWLNSFRGE